MGLGACPLLACATESRRRGNAASHMCRGRREASREPPKRTRVGSHRVQPNKPAILAALCSGMLSLRTAPPPCVRLQARRPTGPVLAARSRLRS
jgi:hypothetical protein